MSKQILNKQCWKPINEHVTDEQVSLSFSMNCDSFGKKYLFKAGNGREYTVISHKYSLTDSYILLSDQTLI